MRTTTDPSGRRARGARTAAAALAAAALVAGGLLAASPAGAAPAPVQNSTLPTGIGGQTHLEAGRYIVTLKGDPAASYTGGVNGYAATAPKQGRQLLAGQAPVANYSKHLESEQKSVAKDVGATVDYSYSLTVNAFAADLTAQQAAELRADKRVAALDLDDVHHLTKAVPSTDFLGLSGDDGVWAELGGTDRAGEGVVVGVIDSGIAPENPSFAGDALAGSAGAKPWTAGGSILFQKGDGDLYSGVCQPGKNADQQWTGNECNTKLVGARYYINGWTEARAGTPDIGEYISPRDGDGHGSHTASTAAGNADVAASVSGRDYGTISGVAPAAKVAMYKACWSGPDAASEDDDGCASSDLIAAIEQATRDGVDVINYSIGGGSATTTVSPTDIAFLGAASAGIFVAASAGNDGPGASTLDNAAPWETTVAASTIPTYYATATFPGQPTPNAFAGASVTVTEKVEAEVVYAGDIGAAGVADPTLCQPGDLDPAKATGKIVVCDRGVNARAEKSQVVKDAGGVGMILVNVVEGSIDADDHAVPSVHLDAQYRDAVLTAARTPGQTAVLTPDNTTETQIPTPQLAGFSSRGPVLADGSDILKPDVAAPGVAILADGANAQGEEPTWEFLSGTSMASPHVAGLAALYLGAHPLTTPAEIKSALMTTAYDTVDETGAKYEDPFGQGAGHVDPTKMFSPGLVYLNGPDDWAAYIEGIGYELGDDVNPIDPSQLNLASIAIGQLTAPETITRTVTARTAGTYTADVNGLAGVDATVSPSSFTVAEGESISYTITFDRTTAPVDEWSTGYLSWTSGDTVVRSPLAVKPVSIVAPATVTGTGTSGSVDVEVTPGADGPLSLTTTGLSKGALLPDPTGADPEHSGTGSTGDSYTYDTSVPEGAGFARFDLDALDDAVDLDLTVYRLEGGEPVEGWQSATASGDERVDLDAPTAGDYQVIVDVYDSAGAPTSFDLTVTSVVPAGAAPLTLDPSTIQGVQGEKTSYRASWSGLDAQSHYLGIVSYGDTGVSTVVDVATGEGGGEEPGAPQNTEPPTITGTPVVGSKLTADPGAWDVDGLEFAYQWQKDGADIAGATTATYTPKKADAGAALTVVVTATKADLPPGTATSAPVTVLAKSSTKVDLSSWSAFSWSQVKATVKVTGAAGGTVQLKVDGKAVGAPLAVGPNGKVATKLPKLSRGIHKITAAYSGSDGVAPSTSPVAYLVIWF
ncbi:S8 family serine peptidase [Schumannella sp. 10F1B-5-1]|uniref:S8 family serine peptidase n=1 Tax=Schumannella sp. 10F1B-5-1 TaxID=2590780 RepID=UPI0011307D07|nr:S8 family serine peptidase [Schumannella sp. 10F1B-5-1]TPW72774.1 S8 family serine peptidase [Schumannella sp. 10F1B-5-1]